MLWQKPETGVQENQNEKFITPFVTTIYTCEVEATNIVQSFN